MKISSWTRQQEGRSKCPKRFYFRYLDQTEETITRRSIVSIRELGGSLVHQTLAQIIRSVAKGERLTDFSTAPTDAAKQFATIILTARHADEHSAHLRIAEFENGIEAEEEIHHWQQLISTCVENGIRVLLQLGLRADSEENSAQPEIKVRYTKAGLERRGVIDLLLRQGKNYIVVDWKCHRIENADITQVREYQKLLSNQEGIPPSRLTGLVVDLIREETLKVDFNPLNQLLSPRRHSLALQHVSDPQRERFPARPSLENCQRCAFASTCSDSLFVQKEVIS